LKASLLFLCQVQMKNRHEKQEEKQGDQQDKNDLGVIFVGAEKILHTAVEPSRADQGHSSDRFEHIVFEHFFWCELTIGK